MTGPIECAHEVRRLRDTRDAISAELDQVKKDLEVAEERLIRSLIDNQMPSITIGGRRFEVAMLTRVSAKAGAKQVLLERLVANGYGDLVKPDIHTQTLGGFVRELLEDATDLPEWLDECVSVFEKPRLSVKKA